MKKAFLILRAHHWIKNLLILGPIIVTHSFIIDDYLQYLLAVVTFSLCASSIYLFNDYFDLEDDLKNNDKSERAYASGSINSSQLWLIIIALNSLVFMIEFFYLKLGISYSLGVYILINILYTIRLKRIKYIDIFCLVIFYCIRVYIGLSLIKDGSHPSNWFYLFIFLLFLSLASSKRYTSLIKKIKYNSYENRPYINSDLLTLKQLVLVPIILCNIIFAWYFLFEAQKIYQYPKFLFLIPLCFLFFSIAYIKNLASGNMRSDPVVAVIKDVKLCFPLIALMIIFIISY